MIIAGVDEVGRGCLAGPVVAACVVLKDDFFDERIIDSKKLNEAKREYLYDIILKNVVSYGIGSVCSFLIDRINILNATKQAMHIAISKLIVKPEKLL